MSTPTEHPSSHVPSENLLGRAHDLVGANTDDLADIVRKAKDEFKIMPTAGYPLWISSSNLNIVIHLETLNYGEYL
jgi:hypothetical protein